MSHTPKALAAVPALLALALAACTVEPDVDTVPEETRTDAPADEHLDAIRDTEPRVDPQVDDYHRVDPESKENPEEDRETPAIPPPDHPLPRLEGDPTPVPASGQGEQQYREEPTTTRQEIPLDSDPPTDD